MKDYFVNFGRLITSLSEESYLSTLYSFNLYNEINLLGKVSNTVMDSISISDDDLEDHDMILNLVISNMKVVTNWVEFYGMNFTETLELDFNTYHVMLSELQKYNATVREISQGIKDKLKQQEPH